MDKLESLIEVPDWKDEIDTLISALLSNKAKQKTLKRFFEDNDELTCKALLVSLFLKKLDKIKGRDRRDRLEFLISYAVILYRRKTK